MFDKALNTLLWYEDDNGFNVTLLSQTQENFSVWFVGKRKKTEDANWLKAGSVTIIKNLGFFSGP